MQETLDSDNLSNHNSISNPTGQTGPYYEDDVIQLSEMDNLI